MKEPWEDQEPIWKCNYVEGCNKSSYYHVCTNHTKNSHIFICPEHLDEYLGLEKKKIKT